MQHQAKNSRIKPNCGTNISNSATLGSCGKTGYYNWRDTRVLSRYSPNDYTVTHLEALSECEIIILF